MFEKVQGEVGTSRPMMFIGAVVGVVLAGVGIALMLNGFWTFGLLWTGFWVAFTAWDLYRAMNARARRGASAG